MPTTIRDYRLVLGQTREEAILDAASKWTGDPLQHSSMIVLVQTPDSPRYDTYVYECHTFQRAIDIIVNTFSLVREQEGVLLRFEWERA